jgi:hypothetical protein
MFQIGSSLGVTRAGQNLGANGKHFAPMGLRLQVLVLAHIVL